jgi:hypothetical protein
MRPLPWYADRKFYGVVVASLVLKVAWFTFYVTTYRHSTVAGHLKYDLETWREYLQHLRQGGIPYVDFPREYPVGAGAFYWLLSPLFHAYSEPHDIHMHCAVMSGIDVLNTALFWRIATASAAWRWPTNL